MKYFLLTLLLLSLSLFPVGASVDDLYTGITFVELRGSEITDDGYANSSSFTFRMMGEELNTGPRLRLQFTSTCTESFVITSTNIDVIDDPRFGEACGDAITHKTYTANRRVAYDRTQTLHFYNQTLEKMPDGHMTISLNTKQPAENTFSARVTISDGEIDVAYDELPEFWNDYEFVDNNPQDFGMPGDEVSFPMFSMLVGFGLIPVVRQVRSKFK